MVDVAKRIVGVAKSIVGVVLISLFFSARDLARMKMTSPVPRSGENLFNPLLL